MSGDVREMMIELGETLGKENDAASDLWSWLPSCKAAEKAHGDHAHNFRPAVADVMREAAMFLGHKMSPTAEQAEEAGDFYRCPCGEDHSEGARGGGSGQGG